MKKRHGAFGLISYITPIALPILLVVFYAPFIAALLQAGGWSRGVALGSGLLVSTAWLGMGAIVIAVLPPRFAKLNFTLQFLVFGLPLLGVFGIPAWIVIRTLWHMMR